MTIKDTIPKWYEPKYTIGPKKRCIDALAAGNTCHIYVDVDYIMFGGMYYLSPQPTDRYYFRIKLKTK